MDRATTDMIVVVMPFVLAGALIVVGVLWRPPALRRAIERHPIAIDRGFRLAMVAAFAFSLSRGEGWPSLIFLLLAIIGTALGRRRPA